MSYNISQVKWQQAAPLLKIVREKVFVCERRIPKKLEFDQGDKTAYHMLICDGISNEPIATGRITPQGEISRIAVIMSYRSKKSRQIYYAGVI
jgi:predicted GNAT family N-acyltransferase